jgi:hypothetical protein
MLSQTNLASFPNLQNFHWNTVTLECDLEKQRTGAQSCNIGSIGWLPITSHSRFEKLGVGKFAMMDGMKIQKKSVFRQDLSSSSLTA